MTCFVLPVWVIARIDKIRRHFLWGRNDSASGISLINWDLACTPREWGGLGLPNLTVRNRALVLRWWWRLHANPESLWTETIQAIKGRVTQPGPKIYILAGSFFWRQLQGLKPLFHWSSQWKIGDGFTISFWFDNWGETVVYTGQNPRPRRQKLSLREAVPIIEELDQQLVQPVTGIPFSQELDVLVWRWEATGLYSAASLYRILMGGGKIKFGGRKLWKYRAPETVKIFVYLMLRQRILTHDMLFRRNIPCAMHCVMCQSCPMETALHLLFRCSYAMRVWRRLTSLIGYNILVMGHDIESIWLQSIKGRPNKPGSWVAKGPSLLMCACWFIWKQRCDQIFRGQKMQPELLARVIMQEAKLWMEEC